MAMNIKEYIEINERITMLELKVIVLEQQNESLRDRVTEIEKKLKVRGGTENGST